MLLGIFLLLTLFLLIKHISTQTRLYANVSLSIQIPTHTNSHSDTNLPKHNSTQTQFYPTTILPKHDSTQPYFYLRNFAGLLLKLLLNPLFALLAYCFALRWTPLAPRESSASTSTPSLQLDIEHLLSPCRHVLASPTMTTGEVQTTTERPFVEIP